MILYSIERGMTLFIAEGPEESDMEIKAKFVSAVSDKVFYIYNDEISDNIEEYKDKLVNVSLFFGDGNYKAECRIVGKGPQRGVHETIRLEALSGFVKEARRSSTRVEKVFPVQIYNFAADIGESYRGDLICGAYSKDISRDGIYLAADYKLDVPRGTMFTVGFELASHFFNIPSKVMRIQKTGAYSYDYGFLFDFSEKNMPAEQDKLISAIFKVKLNI
jgi:hypothetical protein